MVFENEQAIIEFAIKAKLPDWQAQLFAKNRHAIQVHSKGELFFKIDRLFPHEHPQSKRNRLLSFEPITQGSFQKAIDQISRIFTSSSYDVECSETTLAYINRPVFDDKNLFSYYLDLWVNIALGDDPNAMFVVYPQEFTDTNELEQVEVIKSCDLLYMDAETIVFKSEKRSEVINKIEKTCLTENFFFDYKEDAINFRLKNEYNATYANRLVTEYVKTTYHVFTQDKFYEFLYTDDPTEFEITEITLRNTRYTPAIAAGGVKVNKVYQSFLFPFVPFGNLALIQHSQHCAVNSMYAFPNKAEIETPCDAEGCQDGRKVCPISDKYPDGECPCDVCGGTGWTTVQSPYKVYKRRLNPAGMSEEDKAALSVPPVEFYSPDVGILTYSKDEWKSYLEKAERAVYINQDRTTGNVQSADSKEMDLEQFFSFLLLVAKSHYNILRFIIQQIENYSNNKPVNVVVETPTSFAILTEAEAFQMLNTYLTSAAPDIIKGLKIENFLTKFINNSSPVAKAYEVLKRVDILLLKSDNQIATLKSNNIVTAEQWAVHTFCYPLLMQMYEEDKELFLLDVPAIADKLKEGLTIYKPVQQSPLKTAAQAAAAA